MEEIEDDKSIRLSLFYTGLYTFENNFTFQRLGVCLGFFSQPWTKQLNYLIFFVQEMWLYIPVHCHFSTAVVARGSYSVLFISY